jgi:AcrR family transcriptional regulator
LNKSNIRTRFVFLFEISILAYSRNEWNLDMQEVEKINKKDLIYKEAAKLFREKGYTASTMRDLAERVQLKASSLYSHIGSKEEILRKICFDNANHFVNGMEHVELMQTSSVEKIKTLLLLHIKAAIEDTTSVTVFNDEWRHLTEPNLGKFVMLRKDYENRFRKIIKEGIKKNELKKLDTEILLYSLLNAVQWLHYWYRPNRKIKTKDLENNIIVMLMDGIVSNTENNKS